MGTRDVSQCFGCGVVGEGEVDIDDGLFYCFACWLIYHAARARLRRDCVHVQPKRNLQGVSCAPEGAQHERSVQNVSSTFGQRPQLHRLGTCTERCTVQNASSVFEQRARQACTQITTRGAPAAGRRVRSVLLQHRAGHCRAVTRTELHRLLCSRRARCIQVRHLRESAHVTRAARLLRGRRMTLKPSSFKLELGMQVQTPKVTALWRGVKNTSTRTSLKRRILQGSRIGSGEEVRERAGVSARESVQVEVRGESTLVWRRR